MNTEFEIKKILYSGLTTEQKATMISEISIFNKDKIIQAIGCYGTGTPEQINRTFLACCLGTK